MVKEIKIWADYACPYSYIGEKELFDILEQEGTTDKVKIQFLSYQLDPNAPEIPTETMTEHFMSGHEYTLEQSEHLMQKITDMAASVGLDYKLATTQVCNTFDAHRLMEFAQDSGLPQDTLIKLNLALFHANFIENLRLSDHTVLLTIAEQCGLNATEVREVLESDRYADRVKAEEQELDARPDFEFIPYMLFDNTTVLQGVISSRRLKKTLN